MDFDSIVIFWRQRTVNKFAEQILVILAVHCSNLGCVAHPFKKPGTARLSRSQSNKGETASSLFVRRRRLAPLRCQSGPCRELQCCPRFKNGPFLGCYRGLFCCLSKSRYFILSLCNCDFDLPTEHPSIPPISSC